MHAQKGRSKMYTLQRTGNPAAGVSTSGEHGHRQAHPPLPLVSGFFFNNSDKQATVPRVRRSWLVPWDLMARSLVASGVLIIASCIAVDVFRAARHFGGTANKPNHDLPSLVLYARTVHRPSIYRVRACRPHRPYHSPRS